ncbi:MAG: hypothetical protein ACOZNI_19945 [Myxococcota bacterium]
MWTALLALCVSVVWFLSRLGSAPGTPDGDLKVVAAACLVLATVGILAAALNVWATTLIDALAQRVQHEHQLDLLLHSKHKVDAEWKAAEPVERRSAERDFDRAFGETDAESLKDLIGSTRLYARACSYCGNASAPVFCSACRSVQYNNLSRDHLSPAMPRWWWSAAVFYSLNRFQIFSSGGPPVLAALVALSAPAILSHRDQVRADHERYEQSTRQFIEKTIAFRSSLETLESSCGYEIATDLCRDAYSKLLDGFYYFSWFSGPIIRHLRETRCGGGPNDDPLIQRACDAVSNPVQDPSDVVDGLYVNYYNQLTGPASSRDPTARRLAARNLYYGARNVSCIVTVLSWRRTWESEGMRREGCPGMLLAGWSAETALPACTESDVAGDFALCWRAP